MLLIGSKMLLMRWTKVVLRLSLLSADTRN